MRKTRTEARAYIDSDSSTRPLRRISFNSGDHRFVDGEDRARSASPSAYRSSRGRRAVLLRTERLVGNASQTQPCDLGTDLRARANRSLKRASGIREHRAVARA